MREAQIAVVGGGPGGLTAALAAAKAGAQVTLIDGYATLGGQYYRQSHA
jgi:sarcosine oxidase subunit alpha